MVFKKHTMYLLVQYYSSSVHETSQVSNTIYALKTTHLPYGAPSVRTGFSFVDCRTIVSKCLLHVSQSCVTPEKRFTFWKTLRCHTKEFISKFWLYLKPYWSPNTRSHNNKGLSCPKISPSDSIFAVEKLSARKFLSVPEMKLAHFCWPWTLMT